MLKQSNQATIDDTFMIGQLGACFSKIKVVDHSIDLDDLFQKISKY